MACFGGWALGILVAGAGACLQAADFPGTMVLGRPTDTLIAANLIAPTAMSVYLEYGPISGAFERRSETVDLMAGQPRELELRNLVANTRHHYRIRFRPAGASEYDASPEFSFMTARPPGSTFVFGVQGDSHPERTRIMFDAALYTRTMQLVAADRPDFYFLLGDDFSVDTMSRSGRKTPAIPIIRNRPRMRSTPAIRRSCPTSGFCGITSRGLGVTRCSWLLIPIGVLRWWSTGTSTAGRRPATVG